MLQKNKISSFVELGKFLAQFSLDNSKRNHEVQHNDRFFDSFETLLALSQSHNGWFTQEQVYFAVNSWAETLIDENLSKWLSNYDFSKVQSKTVGLILAGNIPLVGFHDFLSVLISGNNALVKQSSNDKHFLPLIAKFLQHINPSFIEKITFINFLLLYKTQYFFLKK